MLRLSDSHLSLEVTGSADAAGRGGPVGRSETEQGLKGGHGLSPAIVTKDELIQVDGKLGAADAVAGADQPLLKVADGAVGQRHDRWDASTQVTAQGLRPGDVAKPGRGKSGEGLQTIRIDGRARCHALCEKPGEGGRPEVGHDPHADTARAAAPPFDGHQHECGPPAFQLAAPAQPWLWATNPGVVDLDLAMQRLAGGVDHGSAQFVEHQPRRFIAAEPELALQPHRRNPPRVRRHQIRRPEPLGQRQLGVVEDGPRGQRDLVPAARALPPALVDEHIRVPAPTARTHESVRPPARSQILSAGVFGGELALKLGQTLGESWAGHTPTLHIGVC